MYVSTCIIVDTFNMRCVFPNIAFTMSATQSPIVVFVYPFKHLTTEPLKWEKTIVAYKSIYFSLFFYSLPRNCLIK